MDLRNMKSPEYVNISLPLTKNGKFRWKRPSEDQNDLDITQATKNEVFDEKTYLEWQVGYDIPVSDIENNSTSKETKLKKWTFFSEAGVEKYPFEIAEYMLEAVKNGIIDEIELDNLIEKISNNNDDIAELSKPKILLSSTHLNVNGLSCVQNAVILPSTKFTIPGTKAYIRINVEKQQKGSAYQPMLYLCIPITCLENGERYLGKCAQTNEKGILKITEKTQNILICTFELLASLSKRHKHDVLEILKILKKYIKEDK